MSANLRLRMTRTTEGSLNGRDVAIYAAGSVYELPDQGPDGLAEVFLREGWAERVVEVALAPALPEVEDTPAPRRTRRKAQK